MRARVLLAAGLFVCASAVSADGGRLRAFEDAGAFRVAIFTRPEPLAAGPADVSVLVQDRMSGETVLDADVSLVFTRSDGAAVSVSAGRHARNRLFYGSVAELTPGAWTVTSRIRRGTARAEIRTSFEVEEAAHPIGTWPYLAIPPLAVALFAANRGLRDRERKRRTR